MIPVKAEVEAEGPIETLLKLPVIIVIRKAILPKNA